MPKMTNYINYSSCAYFINLLWLGKRHYYSGRYFVGVHGLPYSGFENEIVSDGILMGVLGLYLFHERDMYAMKAIYVSLLCRKKKNIENNALEVQERWNLRCAFGKIVADQQSSVKIVAIVKLHPTQ